jgi:hypothetical protein
MLSRLNVPSTTFCWVKYFMHGMLRYPNVRHVYRSWCFIHGRCIQLATCHVYLLACITHTHTHTHTHGRTTRLQTCIHHAQLTTCTVCLHVVRLFLYIRTYTICLISKGKLYAHACFVFRLLHSRHAYMYILIRHA